MQTLKCARATGWLMLWIIVPALKAGSTKGDRYYEIAQRAEDRGEHEKALESYMMALGKDPANPAYQMAVRRERFQVAQIHLLSGEKLRKEGSLQAALSEFRAAFAVDPSSTLALQEIQRTSGLIERARRGEIKPGAQNLTAEDEDRQRKLQRLADMLPVPTLRPVSDRIATLKMNNQPAKVLYETVGKIAGINVIFDPLMQGPLKNANLDITDTTLEEALDYLAVMTKTYWKPVSANTIFVTEDNPTKRRDYEEQVLKVFYLHNMTSVQEFQEVVTAVRSALDLRRMYTFNAGNAVVARGSADQIALAEKLFHDLDQPKAEIVVDIVVLETKTSRTREIAMGLVSNGNAGLSIPVGFSPRSSIAKPAASSSSDSSSTSTTIGAGNIGKVGLDDFSVTLPGALLEAVMSDSSTRIMQSPQVRVSDGQKASLKIGDRVPFASGSYQAGVTGTSLSPLVSTQFNFVDTGVILELTPHVHNSGELTLHVAIDISAVSQQVNIGGLNEPEITQHKEETDIRVRDGEVNLLGGLTQLQETKTLSGVPGLVNIPVLGRLLGDNSNDKSRGELLIALIPHIVRTTDITALNLREVATGPDQALKVNWAPRSRIAPAPQVATPASPDATAPGNAPRVALSPGNVEIATGGKFSLTLNAENVRDLFSAGPVRFKWNPAVLRLEGVTPGELLKQDDGNAAAIDIRNDAGEAVVRPAQGAGAAVAGGSSSLVQLAFTAVGKGASDITVEAVLQNSQQQRIEAAASGARVTVH